MPSAHAIPEVGLPVRSKKDKTHKPSKLRLRSADVLFSPPFEDILAKTLHFLSYWIAIQSLLEYQPDKPKNIIILHHALEIIIGNRPFHGQLRHSKLSK